MTATSTRTSTRAGAVIAIGRSGRGRVRSAFAREADRPTEFTDGALTLAAMPARSRQLHIGRRIVCLLEGVLYEPPGGAAALAAAYEREGDRVLAALRGEFWALLWDREGESGCVVCDQLGTRSPYWTVESGTLLCASEVPELLAARLRRPAPDPVALAHWLTASLPPGGATLYAGLRRLEAGHVLELSAQAPSTRRYWAPSYRPPLPARREELVSRVRAALERAVSRRLGEPGAQAVLLSGGLDSGSVAALARTHDPGLSAYSAVFPHHPDVDESDLIDHIRLPGARVVVHRPGVLAGALDYLRAWELPPTSPNMFFWAPLFEQAATDGIGLMLDGEGGDEVFGFSPYLLADRLRHGRPRAALRLAGQWPGRRGVASGAAVRERVIEYGIRGALPPAAHLITRRMRGLEAYAPSWLRRPLARAWLESSESSFAWKRLDGPRWWAHLAAGITRGTGPAAAYEQARRRAGLAGIESSHPLVDVDLVELMLGVDPLVAFEPRHSRPLLREAVVGQLPDPVRLRPAKSYFDSVFHEGLAAIDLPLARRLLDPRDAELSAYLDVQALNRELFEGEVKPSEAWALSLWRCLTAECWLRHQADPEVCERLGVEASAAEISIEFRTFS